MPLIMKRVYTITGNYTDEEKKKLECMVRDFRIRMADDDPEKNILNKKKEQYTDNKIVSLLTLSTGDINGGSPKTNYTMFQLYDDGRDDLIVLGAMVFALIEEGILQVRNQVDFSDSGVSIALSNKTSIYQGWAAFILQQYNADKAEFKRGVIPSSHNSGFYGISSEFANYWY